MPVLEFVGQSRKDSDNPTAATAHLLNLYREPYEGGHVLKAVLGTSAFVSTGDVQTEAMVSAYDRLWTVSGGILHEIDTNGTISNRGAVATGDASICGNNGNICVAAGGTYYVWDGTALQTPTGGAFSAIGSVCFLAQQTIRTEQGGRRFDWTGVADPTSLDPLDFATAEGTDDDILRGVALNGALLLLKQKAIEIWTPTSTGFEPISLGVIETGLLGYDLIAQYENGLIFVGHDGIVYRMAGTAPEPISFPAVETDISQSKPTHCFYYEEEGHKFPAIRFSDRPAWVFDNSTGEWHRRAYGTDHAAWPVVHSASLGRTWYVADEFGDIHKMGRFNADTDVPLRRTAVSRTLEAQISISELRLFGNVGQIAAEPEIMVRMSKNYGMTWGAERWVRMGALGEYLRRLRLQGLGWAEQWTMEVSVTDPVDVQLQARAMVA